MTEKCKERCPHCADDVDKYGDRYHRVYYHNGHPRCERHGCVLRAGEWEFWCSKCGEHVDKLHGLLIPHLCKECFDTAVEAQRKAGNICGICKQVRMLCCC